MKLPMALIIGAVVIVACDSTTGSRPSQPVADNSLHKKISFSVHDPNSSLSTGMATLSRSSVTSSWIYWMLPVTNTGSSAVSLIAFDTISFNDAFSDTVTLDPQEFVTGSVMKLVVTGTFTNSCLQPAEIGYIFGIFNDQSLSAYTRIASATAQTATYLTTGAQLPKADVQGVGFSTTSSALFVTITNTGSTDAQFDTSVGAGVALLRDNQGSPVYWTVLNPTTTLLLAPHDSCKIADYSFDYSAQFNDLLYFPLYDDYGSIAHKRHATPVLRGAFDCQEAFLQALIARRNSLEVAERMHD